MPKVSVITPSYNHARFLPERVASIFGQTFQDFEWIIIDDCSTDGSQEMVHGLVSRDPRVTLLFHDQNAGMAKTTREAIEASSGKYIYRAESDDVCHPYFLERMVQVLDDHPQVGFAYCRGLHMDEEGNLWGGLRQEKEDCIYKGPEFFSSLVMGNFIPGPNIVFTRQAHDRVGGFGIGHFQVACDWHFSLRLCLHFDVAYVSEPLGYHRTHSSNLSGALGRTFNLDMLFNESYGLLMDIFESIPNELSLFRELKKPALRSMTLRVMVPTFIRAILKRRWEVAWQIIAGVNRYDPGITKAAWFGACIRSLVFNIGYVNLYTPMAQLISRCRSADRKEQTFRRKTC